MNRNEEIDKKVDEISRRHIRMYSTLFSQETYVPLAVREAAYWVEQHPRKGLIELEKACEFIRNNAQIEYDCEGFIEDFRKAMTEE